MKKDVQKKKKDFAAKYQGKEPAALARLAAAQRANLYTPGLDHRCVFPYWESLLKEYAEKYRDKKRDEDVFIQDCEEIKRKMNNRYGLFFQNGREAEGFEEGFRFSHAQKSLSVMLKHLWCREELSTNNPKYYPPVCPIDGIILRKAGSGDSWTKVNYVSRNKNTPIGAPVYKEHLNLVKEKAKQDGFDSLSEWELFQWPGNTVTKTQGNKTSKPTSQAVKEKRNTTERISRGEIIPGRSGNTLDGWHIINGTDDFFLYVAISKGGRRLYCEVYSPNGQYSQSVREKVCPDLDYIIVKTPYFVRYFNTSDETEAKRLMQTLKTRLV